MKKSPIQPIPQWWQLPFAIALTLHGKLLRHCQWCGQHYPYIGAVQHQPHAHQHWFNQLAFICQKCHHSIHWQSQNFSLTLPNASTVQGVASVAYQFPYQNAITGLKNSHNLTQLMPLVHAIRQLTPPIGCHANNSVIAPVPSTTKRLTERGFDPLYWLACYLSFHWQIPLFWGVEREERQHQQGLSREARLDNVKNAFYLTHDLSDLSQLRHIIVFDDVVTTGATLSAVIEAFYDVQFIDKYQFHAVAVLHGRHVQDAK
ncbi:MULTISPECIES: ComF family protein [unclassified Moraxella]|uniref:ComF family protein n=1 Tax=unclassified Moraxella TaxID=2685852 RepID=UPI003AF8C07E